ncbi:IclR family transcriptional regulator [Kocuria rhizophila]|uniref:IclR family transcriptional regulator n=1 Tax=Kocuria rhizophila TaxID=72000 RepID=UPI003898DD26
MSTQSVDTALAALEELALAGPLGLSELARRRAVSKATLLRHLKTMQTRGWVEQLAAPDSRWRYISPHAAASPGQGGATLREAALGIMADLQTRTTETVHLCERQGPWMVLRERVDSSHTLRTYYPMGTKFAMHASANGLAYLASLPESEARRMLHPPLAQITPFTMTDPDRVMDAVRAARERGYSINMGGSKQEVYSIGAGIMNAEKGAAGTLSISGAAVRFSAAHIDEAGKWLIDAAQRIGTQLR